MWLSDSKWRVPPGRRRSKARLSGGRNQSTPQLAKSGRSQAKSNRFAIFSRRKGILPKGYLASQNLQQTAERQRPIRLAPPSRCVFLLLALPVSPNWALLHADRRRLLLRLGRTELGSVG